jgi:hypothetical protein
MYELKLVWRNPTLTIPSLLARRWSNAASIHKLRDSVVKSVGTARLRVDVSGETIRVWISLRLVVNVLHVIYININKCWYLILYLTYQYSETNVMHSLFSLLRIKGLYMFRALLAHPQNALHKRHLVYCVRVMSVGCTRIGVELPTDITRTQYTKCCLYSASWGWASNARNMYRPLILNKLNKKCIMLVSLYWYTVMRGQHHYIFTILIYCDARSTSLQFHYTDILWCAVNITTVSLYWYTMMHGQQNIKIK